MAVKNLREQIPNEFFNLFASSNLDIYITYLTAIYDAVFGASFYNLKALTKYDCRDIVTALNIDQTENEDKTEDVRTVIFENRYLNRLVNWGWLKLTFNADLNDDVVTIPEYSKLFIAVFKTITEQITTGNAAMSDIFSFVFTYTRTTRNSKKDPDFLKKAKEAAESLSVTLTSSIDLIDIQVEEMMKQEKAVELLEQLLRNVSVKENIYTENSDHGKFNYYNGAVETEIKRELKTLRNTADNLENKITDETDKDTQKVLQNQIDGCYAIIEMLKDIQKETERAKNLYGAMIERRSDMVTRALQKLKYINAKTTQENRSRQLQMVQALAKERKNGGHSLVNKLSRILAFPMNPTAFLSSPAYSPARNLSGEGEMFVIPDAKANPKGDGAAAIKPKYSLQELTEFEQRFRTGDYVSIKRGDLKTPEDIEKMMYLMVRSSGESERQYDYQKGEIVRLPDGAAYTELSYRIRNGGDFEHV